MSAHTPGPWVYGDWIRRKEGEYDGAGWVEVWSQADPDNCLPIIACKHGNEMANARLIAAAPELLEALQKFVAWSKAENDHKGTTFWERVEMLRDLDASAAAAIAKATGSQQ